MELNLDDTKARKASPLSYQPFCLQNINSKDLKSLTCDIR
jgi:hypothetical protein